MGIDESVSVGADGRERDSVGSGSGVGRFCFFLSCNLNRRVEVC